MTNPDIQIPDRCLVEWWAQPASIATGIVGNLPPVRRIGVVWHTRKDGTLLIFDHDNVRCIVDPARVTILSENVEAGWGRFATGPTVVSWPQEGQR